MRKFRDVRTEKLFRAESAKGIPPDVAQRAHNRLRIVARMTSLHDLQVFPGMKPEPLKGDRKGQHSVRVNDKWRICFVWNGAETMEIEFVDYH
ncbi:MAG: type II toxin-antitoxin system RelE/ParE family toxin [Alphaproteobacteria bacterium]